MGIPEEKIVYIPNGIDPAFLEQEPESPDALRARHGLERKFVVAYIGTHGMSHGLDILLDAARVQEGDPGIHFPFSGDGAERERLVARTR